MKHIITTAIKCSDGKTRTLCYDLIKQTEASVAELGMMFAEIEKRFPDVQFWIQQYPNHANENFINIHGDKIQESLKIPNAIRQIDEIRTPEDFGLTDGEITQNNTQNELRTK